MQLIFNSLEEFDNFARIMGYVKGVGSEIAGNWGPIKEKPAKEKPAKEKPAENAPVTDETVGSGGYTLGFVRQAAVDAIKADADNGPAVKKILKKMGVDKTPNLKPDQYEEFYDAVQALLV